METPWKILNYETLPSTMDEAHRLVSTRAHPFVVAARLQTKGRGRLGRSWQTGEGNVYMSVCLPVVCEPHDFFQFSFLAGVALHRVVAGLLPHQNVRLKWPNDLLFQGKKVAGVLIETAQTTRSWIIMGMGVNAAWAPTLTGKYDAIALKEALAQEVPACVLVENITKEVRQCFEQWESQGFEKILQEWRGYAHMPGDVLEIDDGHGLIYGHFLDVDAQGRLLVKITTGEIKVFSCADVGIIADF